jgi:hypothetical protein
VVIPGTITGLPVTSIGEVAFADVISLTNLTIPPTVTSIGSYAFTRCIGLVSATIPGSVTNVGAEAFAGCTSLGSLTIENGVSTIGRQAFFWCSSLTSVTLPDSVKVLEDGGGSMAGPVNAFAYCTSLTNVVIGKGLTYLAPGTFAGCFNLLGVFFQGDAPEAPYLFGFGAFRFADSAIVYYLPVYRVRSP